MQKILVFQNKYSRITGLALLTGLFILFGAAGWCLAVDGTVQGKPSDTGNATGVFEMKRWSPYVVGICIGLLSWLAFVLSDHPIGVSTAYAQTAGLLEKGMLGKYVEKMAYYREYVPRISWTWMLVVGVIIGAFVSARLSGEFRLEWVPPFWTAKFGYTPIIRWAVAFIGGALLGIGARWADGCTSGHGISGALQLVVSSWVAVICFFIGGVVTAFLIY